MRKIVSLLFVLMAAILPIVSMAATSITDVRWITRNDAPISYVRTVIEMTGPPRAEAEISKDGLTTKITLKNMTLGQAPKDIVMNPQIVKGATFQQVGADVVMTFTTPNPLETSDVHVFPLKKSMSVKSLDRLVVDVKQKNVLPREFYYGKSKPKPVAKGKDTVKTPAKDKAKKPEPVTKKSVNFRTSGDLKGKVIVIDPGHGGTDVGAVGKDGTYEKDITLPISEKLATLLRQAGAKVVMTRTTDVDVYGPHASDVDELQARADVGNRNDADIFISVHINSFTNPNVGGISDYYYTKTPHDRRLAMAIQRRIGDKEGFGGDRGTNEAGFYVLDHTLMPATLLELGFISNPKEVALLNKPAVQQEFAQLIFEGIQDYFKGE